MAKRRRNKHEEHLNHEAWAIPYADLLVLLLAFFVVLYSLSTINSEKYRVLSEALSAAFRVEPRTITPVQIGARGVPSDPSLMPEERTERDPSPIDLPPQPQALSIQMIQQIADEVEEALQSLIQEGMITVHRDELWLKVEINTNILFPSGSAQIQAHAVPILRRIAEILGRFPNPIEVEGFTDSVPINTMAYPSNWELSAARAASVVHLFMRQGVEPVRMSAIGYGEYRPFADNDTPEGRARNRRVVLVVLADEDIRRLPRGLRDFADSPATATAPVPGQGD